MTLDRRWLFLPVGLVVMLLVLGPGASSQDALADRWPRATYEHTQVSPPNLSNIMDKWASAPAVLPSVSFIKGGATDNETLRRSIIEVGLTKLGHGYVLGNEGPDTFDCSGFAQWSYHQKGIDFSRTTYTQLEDRRLREIQPDQIQTADLIYFQYPKDQHVGMLADIDGDGAWDMLQSGGTRNDVNVVYNVFAEPIYTNAIIGYRTAF